MFILAVVFIRFRITTTLRQETGKEREKDDFILKAQNRTAALRYREKKKLNEKKRLDEVAGLTRRNQELKSKARFFLFDIF
ncbi:hypothetical protein Y032_0221g2547 [Ancylostoma ceylanicum]|uniref:BZIP domain-containing protein n=1 Tax=Ancylostoma ceylanicum TaxID=53326 RepID=A0A016SHY2_9BILA|nr:hypothetical protein Y032_0221g2547 [Ancylostoma ceylanicum]